jgi:16S rRNA (guanine527-N7)-methyltransferase
MKHMGEARRSVERQDWMNEDSINPLTDILIFNGIGDPGAKARQLEAYAHLLRKHRSWAKLVSSSLEQEYPSLIADSLAVVGLVGCKGSKEVADIGAGGGLLGIPCAIACPRWHVTLIEASSRKSAFLGEVAGALGLENVSIENRRAESLDAEAAFDLALSRAAGRLIDVAPTALGMLSTGGRYIAVKASDPAEEIDTAGPSVARSGGRLAEVRDARYPTSLGMRGRASLVVIEKL